MGSKEVVVSYKERGEGDSPIGAAEAVRRFYVVFIGPIKSFYELLKVSELFRLLV